MKKIDCKTTQSHIVECEKHVLKELADLGSFEDGCTGEPGSYNAQQEDSLEVKNLTQCLVGDGPDPGSTFFKQREHILTESHI